MNEGFVWTGVLIMVGGAFFALRGDLSGWIIAGVLVAAGGLLSYIGYKQ